MPKEILIAFCNPERPEMSNVLWEYGPTLVQFIDQNGPLLGNLIEQGMIDPPDAGLWKWEGEPLSDDGPEYADFSEGDWDELTAKELRYFAEHGRLDIEEEEEDYVPSEDSEVDDDVSELDFLE